MRLRLLSLLLLAGCASTPSTGTPGPTDSDPLKGEVASGAFDSGVDWCEEYGWYGDGECDGFCTQRDPDCHVQSLDGRGPTVCAAIRGNGQRIPAHFGAIARIQETWGLIDGAAGGSSGSITTFLLESVQSNPHVRCDDCTPREQGLRAALLFKSLGGYFATLTETDEAQAISALVSVAAQVQEAGVENLLAEDPSAGVAALAQLLQSDELAAFINPELVPLLENSPNPAFHARDIVDALRGAGSFEATDPAIFLRPGVISFETLADRVGRIGTFYAGWEPVDQEAMKSFLGACAEPAQNLPWSAVAGIEIEGGTCGSLFEAMLADFRAEMDANGAAYASRADEPIGRHMHALAMTSVLEGDSVNVWKQARADYLAAREISWEIDFDDVRFGYFGSEADLAQLDRNARGYTDLKTAKRRMLGARSWREILSLSPAEPGLTRALEMGTSEQFGEQVSFGGWSDLHPTQTLQNLGCDRVVYITRRGGWRGFATGVSELLGMSADEDAAIYSAEDPESSVNQALRAADAVWCTDWEAPPQTRVDLVWEDAYNAPVESSDYYFQQLDQVSPHLGIEGCSR